MNDTLIGYYGFPPASVIRQLNALYPSVKFIDLDVDCGNSDPNLVHTTTCQIIRNILANAIALRDSLKLVVCSVGEEKCDGGMFAAIVLEQEGFNVLKCYNSNTEQRPIKISTSTLPLREKIVRIMDTVIIEDTIDYSLCAPKFGFWGVPPHSLELLDLFPNETHVYGWTRCVEAGTPANFELESFVDKNIKIVFFTQSFCQKQILANYLANKYNGLFIDVDGTPTNSVIAKIEAFLEL